MSIRYSTKYVLAVTTIAVLAIAVSVSHPKSSLAAEPVAVKGDTARATIEVTPDTTWTESQLGGKLVFSTRSADGTLSPKMTLTKEGCLQVGDNGCIAGIAGGMELAINDPSRPGTIVMRNVHEARTGCGNTLAFYASGHGQVFLSSAWVGVNEARRVPQMEKGPLPLGYPSPQYPVSTSAARFEISGRINDWVSNMALFEPIADDGRALVTVDREHPYMGQVQYLPQGGEWINNRRIGRHAFMLGTTHNTGATAGGMVLAGDSYHEYKGRGPVIKSPNGTAFRIIVDDEGNLSTEKVK